tara:strand:+ start:104 stop:802 length:699 start_codon:yes stop_codon:yes gene_type:complete
MDNSLLNTNRSSIWNKIVEGRNKLDKRVDEDVRVLGGTGHSLGDAASTGTIQIRSDAAAGAGGGDRKLVLGENTISLGYERTMANPIEFVMNTVGGATNAAGAAAAFDFTITPTAGNNDDLLQDLQAGKIKVGDIFEVSGGEDLSAAAGATDKDETWINTVYRVTAVTGAAGAQTDFTIKTGAVVAAGSELSDSSIAGTIDNDIPKSTKIKFRKLVQVSKFAEGGVEYFYLE